MPPKGQPHGWQPLSNDPLVSFLAETKDQLAALVYTLDKIREVLGRGEQWDAPRWSYNAHDELMARSVGSPFSANAPSRRR